MLVSDQDACEVFRRPADRGEPFANLSCAESGIDENPGFFGLHIGAIAGGTAAKDGEIDGHNITLGRVAKRGKLF